MRILSGIQPTGDKHLGNLIGAIRQYVSYQEQGEAFYCIVDLHALTTQPDPAGLREATLKTGAILIAAGLDPDRCVLFVQSHVGEAHAELGWLLSCVGTFGELSRMTQFKDKSESKKSVSAGLFTYPILQAADILIYDTDVVPVGEDQKQHIELTRDIAERFNARYGETFVLPRPQIPKVGGRIMDLQAPTQKMSTSEGTEKGTVNIADPPERVAKKLKSAVTDSGTEVRAADDKPGITNLLTIMSVASGTPVADLEREYGPTGYGRFKVACAEAVVEYLRPIRERYEELLADRAELTRLLEGGAARAEAVAAPKVREVKRAMGCLPRTVRAPSR
jgi:tryptophanyl-tRNA synthetase